jgi:hypothetical protein
VWYDHGEFTFGWEGDVSERDDEKAGRLAARIVERLQGEFEKVEVEIPPGVSIEDVERDARDFRILAELHKRANIDMLIFAPHDKYPAPFLFREELFREEIVRYFVFDEDVIMYFLPLSVWREKLKSTIDRTRKKFPKGITALVDPTEAVYKFFSGMTDFLRARLEWVLRGSSDGDKSPLKVTLPQRLGGQPSAISSCLFEVSTNSPGLQVLWTPAYAHANNYFGSPTTPVRAPLQAGSYRFGIIGGAYVTPQWALPVHTLPGVPSAHLPY